MLMSVCALSLTACATSSTANSVTGFRLHIDEAVPVSESDAVDGGFVPLVDAATPGPAATEASVDTDARYLSVLVGQRWLQSGEAAEADVGRPFMVGIEYENHDTQSGHGFELGYAWADDQAHGTIDLRYDELYAGYRFTMNADESLQPYFGAGLSYIRATLAGFPGSNEDNAFGAYLRLGLAWAFDRLRFGLDYRHVFTENMHLGWNDQAGGFDQVALSAGWRF
jgi:hypothetical protein